MHFLRLLRRALGVLVLIALLATACSGQPEPDTAEAVSDSTSAAEPTELPQESPGPSTEEGDQEPVPFIPAGRPGNAQDYDELIRRLETELPADLRAEVPWPDTRNPNPIEAQISIFELWIWMAETHPEPALVEIMSAPGSPSREEVTGTFGIQEADNVLVTRSGAGYQAFDHLVVTFESAGLPLWLARDVPEDAVVVYYSDNSGPVEVTNRDTGAVIERREAVATRTWLSIMVPTDVGWLLWRDQLIDPNNSELEVPDVPPPPGADEDRRNPEV